MNRKQILVGALALSLTGAAYAGSATWKTTPASGDWNTATNWTLNTVPNGAGDIATFDSSNTTNLSLSEVTFLDSIVFNAGASVFTITVAPPKSARLHLEFDGLGITNNSGTTQNFVMAAKAFDASIQFRNGATAGNLTAFTNEEDASAVIKFSDASSAGNATFTNGGGTGGFGTGTKFFDASTAANGAFINQASANFGGRTSFDNRSSAGNGTFINNGSAVRGGGGGVTIFSKRSTAANATLIATGGQNGGGGCITFRDNTRGGTARVEIFGNSFLDLRFHLGLARFEPRFTIGSIEGNGNVSLGGTPLIVGSNHLSTNFSGIIQDRGMGGSLTKIGRGKLVLSHRNVYEGGTTIKGGKLIVNNSVDSGTGSGPVQVDGGKLGGAGIIAGAVSVGTGGGSGAVLSPGSQAGARNPGALTIQSPLTFNSDATYEVELNSSSVIADKVIAKGVIIDSGAQFSFSDLGSGSLSSGKVFKVVDNTAATPITGVFSNLADHSTFTSNGNTYQANYEGGDGNDLTLTVQ